MFFFSLYLFRLEFQCLSPLYLVSSLAALFLSISNILFWVVYHGSWSFTLNDFSYLKPFRWKVWLLLYIFNFLVHCVYSVDDIFNQARSSAVPPEDLQKSATPKSCTGTAIPLFGNAESSAAQPPPTITHTITFWRNGFSVDNGPLRRLDDPRNASFIEVNWDISFRNFLS